MRFSLTGQLEILSRKQGVFPSSAGLERYFEAAGAGAWIGAGTAACEAAGAAPGATGIAPVVAAALAAGAALSSTLPPLPARVTLPVLPM
jgi:hypothetical protein